ncbi:WUSCHEL-related homeobox 9-like [Neltuma alba]|uniref:WUSCHEL-related homeobox 9 n=1 Tax=Neltuma alba TaxID=207710 RepID=UPI0010A383C5|nr:WUSCHEL-related homeobox 9 [Prosopis alba]XP_028797384.1 WUSCHEL-related homeobox 9-like [Prosopis alba]
MASSNPNRHWPSMFKSKPCSNSLHHHHQWKLDNINSPFISPSSCHRTSYTSGVEEERSAEPKPRWNPKPEQIRILEAIFNSGMVNPPRDEIRKIRAQLQEYGQVGDANVFYWFQNRKSRSKHKLRNLHNSSNAHQTQNLSNSTHKEIITPPNKAFVSNIVFSDVSSDIVVPISSAPRPPTPPSPTPPQPFFFIPGQQNGGAGTAANSAVPAPITQGFCFSELSSVVQPDGPRDHHQQINVGSCTNSLLLNEIMIHSFSKNDQEKVIMQMQQHLPTTHTTVPPATTTTVTVPSPISQIQGTEEGRPGAPMKSTVFINDVAFEVGVGPLNVGEAFGDDAVLIHASGQPVLIDEWGVTLQPLQHGAFYYLVWKEEICGGGRNGI